jgi:hypothetical protein
MGRKVVPNFPEPCKDLHLNKYIIYLFSLLISE